MLERIERSLAFIASACLAVLAVGVFAQVVLRYGFSITPVWSEEACRILLIWTVLCGAAVSVRGNQHIRVEFLADLLPPGLRRAWYLLIDLATLLFFLVMAGAGIEAVKFNDAMRTVALQWPMSWLLVAVPVGFAAAALFLAERLWRGKGRT